MQRQHPLLSATGLAMTFVVLLVMAVVYWRTGGRMFSPGPLASDHALIEDCASCHQPLQQPQAALCMECHTEIRMELDNANGLHARLKSVEQCMNCHPDHRGADFNLQAEAVRSFDHSLTFFSLQRHTMDFDSSAIECADCHAADSYAPDETDCITCHIGNDPVFMDAHQADFGPGCLDCHDGVDTMADFNHASTLFPLMGIHSETACTACHTSVSANVAIEQAFSGLSTQCAACHEEPELHQGLFQSTCQDCHSPEGWSPALLNGTSFDHFAETSFSLVKHENNFDGSLLDCTSCHTDGLNSISEAVCEQCHIAGNAEFMAQHTSEFGLTCLECHDGLDSMEGFEHNSVFVLDGAHAALACTSCHVDHSFAGTPTDCVGCHEEPVVHLGIFGLSCQNCHTTAAWHPAALTSHSFPLDHGGEGEIPCTTCHVNNFVQFTCDACHAPAEMVQEHNKEGIFDIAGRCLDCHPNGLKEEAGSDD